MGADMSTQVVDDLILAEAIAIPLTLILLLFVFGSVVAALLPLAIAVIAILGSFAQLSLLGSITDVSNSATNLTTALGLGLGIDYALLMISRFREQLATGASVDDAVRRTVNTAGPTVAFSAATVAAALAALLVFPQYFLSSFGYAGVGVVAVAAVGTLFVMPALFVVLGHRVNSGKLPWAKTVRPEGRTSVWGRLARTVMRRPALTALPVLAVMLLAASPAGHHLRHAGRTRTARGRREPPGGHGAGEELQRQRRRRPAHRHRTARERGPLGGVRGRTVPAPGRGARRDQRGHLRRRTAHTGRPRQRRPRPPRRAADQRRQLLDAEVGRGAGPGRGRQGAEPARRIAPPGGRCRRRTGRLQGIHQRQTPARRGPDRHHHLHPALPVHRKWCSRCVPWSST